jgi:hypothetical protein
MPLTRNGVTFTTAYLEAAAIAVADRAMLDTLELYHPALPERLRFVNDHVSLFATLEADAPADAGLEVEFLAKPFRLKPADESDQAGNPDIVIEVDNVSGAISDMLRLARGSLEPWVVTGRIYASDSLAGPAQLPPTVVELRAVQIDSTSARLTCNFGDAGNVAIPALTFKRSEYPTLAR